MKANKINLLGGLILLTLGITSCAAGNLPANQINKANNQKSGNTEIAFNCIRGNVEIDSIYANVGETKTFSITPEENYSIYKVEFNGKEIKPNNNQYSITLEDSNYVRVLFDGGNEDYFKFTADHGDTFYTVSDYVGPDNVKDICLPRTHNGYPVARLSEMALFGLDLDRIYIPECYQHVTYHNYKMIKSLYFYKETPLYGARNSTVQHIVYEGEKAEDGFDGPSEFESNAYNAISDLISKDGWDYYIKRLDNHLFARSFTYTNTCEEVVVPESLKASNIEYPFEYVACYDANVSGIVFSPTSLYIDLYNLDRFDYIFVSANTLSFNCIHYGEAMIYYEGLTNHLFEDKGNVVLNCYNNIVDIDGHLYRIDDSNNTAQLVKWGKSASAIYMPEVITKDNKEYRVTEILSGAFRNSNIAYIYLNDSLETIHSHSFMDAAYIDGGKNLKVIEDRAFTFETKVARFDNIEYIGKENTITGNFYLSKTIKHFEADFGYDAFIYTDYPKSELPQALINLGFGNVDKDHIVFNFKSHSGFDNKLINYDLFINDQGETNARITRINARELLVDNKYFEFPSHVENNIKVTEIVSEPFGENNKFLYDYDPIIVPNTIEYLGHFNVGSSDKIYFSGTLSQFNKITHQAFKEDINYGDVICHENIEPIIDGEELFITYQDSNDTRKAIQVLGYHKWINHTINDIPVVGLDMKTTYNIESLYLGENIERIYTYHFTELNVTNEIYVNEKLTQLNSSKDKIVAKKVYYEGNTKKDFITGEEEIFNTYRYKDYLCKDIDETSLEILSLGLDHVDELMIPISINNKKVMIVNHNYYVNTYYKGEYDEGKDITWNCPHSTTYYFSLNKPTDYTHRSWHYDKDGEISYYWE